MRYTTEDWKAGNAAKACQAKIEDCKHSPVRSGKAPGSWAEGVYKPYTTEDQMPGNAA